MQGEGLAYADGSAAENGRDLSGVFGKQEAGNGMMQDFLPAFPGEFKQGRLYSHEITPKVGLPMNRLLKTCFRSQLFRLFEHT